MQSISSEYLLLFNMLTDAEEALCGLRAKMMEVQQQAEELYLQAGDTEETDK